MSDQSYRSFWILGKFSSLLVGVLFLLVSIGIGLDPIGMVIGYTMDGVINSNILIDVLWRSSFGLIGVLNIAMFTAIALFIRDPKGRYDALIFIAWLLGIFSGLVGSLNWNHFVHVVILYKNMYISGIDVSSFYNNPVFPIDSYYYWTFGAMGIFMVLINYVSINTKYFSRSLAWWGIATGIVSIIIPITYFFELKIPIGPISLSGMVVTGGLCGGILAPIYCFRVAACFKRRLVTSKNEA